LTIENKNVLN